MAVWMLGVLATLIATGTGGTGAPQNVLILLADDLGVDMLASYGEGDDVPPTPNLDLLAQEGMLFRNVWSNPNCTASRATLLTGRQPIRTGLGTIIDPQYPSLPRSEVTIPEMLDIGTGGAWASGAFGKWHLANDYVWPDGIPSDPGSGGRLHPNLSGFQTFSGSLYALECPVPLCSPPWWEGPIPFFDYFNWLHVEDGVETMETTYATTKTVDDVLDFIQSAPEPWFAYVAFNAPHSPYQIPPEGLSSSPLPPGEIGFPVPNPRDYYTPMIEAMDLEIGRLLATLDQIDPTLRGRTNVIFAGDNGTPANATLPPFVGGKAKGTLYEGGVNVPFIVNGPAVEAPGSETAALVSLADVFATVAEMAGVDLEATFPGLTLDTVSFLPTLADPLVSPRSWVFSEHSKPVLVEPYCQRNRGLLGPGSTRMRVCGQVLFDGNTATLRLANAIPGGAFVLMGSSTFAPTPFYGGMLGPWPLEFEIGPLFADAQGGYTNGLQGSTQPFGAARIFLQVVTQDPAQPQGLGITNTVEVNWPTENKRNHVVAAREATHKLIRVLDPNGFTNNKYGPGTPDLLYDLDADPFELNDLLAAGQPPLTPEQQAAYDQLSAALDSLIASAE